MSSRWVHIEQSDVFVAMLNQLVELEIALRQAEDRSEKRSLNQSIAELKQMIRIYSA